jgi:hypothetical protein
MAKEKKQGSRDEDDEDQGKRGKTRGDPVVILSE